MNRIMAQVFQVIFSHGPDYAAARKLRPGANGSDCLYGGWSRGLETTAGRPRPAQSSAHPAGDQFGRVAVKRVGMGQSRPTMPPLRQTIVKFHPPLIHRSNPASGLRQTHWSDGFMTARRQPASAALGWNARKQAAAPPEHRVVELPAAVVLQNPSSSWTS